MKRLGAFNSYLVLEGGSALFFSMVFTASAVYQVTVAMLTPVLWVAIGAFLIISVMRVLINLIYTVWINQGLDSQVRATVIYMSGQVEALGQVAGGPVVGWIGSRFSVRAALLASSLILTSALAFFLPAVSKDEHERIKLMRHGD